MLPLPLLSLALLLPRPPALGRKIELSTTWPSRTWASSSDDLEERSADDDDMADEEDEMSVGEAEEQSVESKRDGWTTV